jgi:hypothetical protein
VDRTLETYLRVGAALLGGVALGLFATWASLRAGYGFGPLRAGPWTAWPAVGESGSDPYARAAVARSGEAPLGRDQGLSFVAATDDDGAPFDARCDYRVSAPAPAARYWTLSLATPDGGRIDNPAGRFGYTSVDLLRAEGGRFDIAIARNVRAGNWLSPGAARRFVVVLRLYETAIDVDARPDPHAFPKIVKRTCA